jgi:hypothetical protein
MVILPITGANDNLIAFVGAIGSAQSYNVAEVQSLWAAAYLRKKMALPSEEDVKEEVALSRTWIRRRYLGDGYNFTFEHLKVGPPEVLLGFFLTIILAHVYAPTRPRFE